MTFSADSTATSMDAVNALRRLQHEGRGLCPAGSDAEQWARDTMQDLASIASLLDGAVESVAGLRNATVGEQGASMASAIRAHSNIELGAAGE